MQAIRLHFGQFWNRVVIDIDETYGTDRISVLSSYTLNNTRLVNSQHGI